MNEVYFGTKKFTGTFREVMSHISEEIAPGNKRYLQMMMNAADTQERIAEEIILAERQWRGMK